MQFLAIIPARYASTRFPGKPLVDIGGKSMIQRVAEQVSKVEELELAVATDDERIYKHVQGLGLRVFMTNPDHPSGTDRCAEVARLFPEARYVLNIQGDEPFVDPAQLTGLLETVQQPGVDIATLVTPIKSLAQLQNPNAVKAAVAKGGRCLYFSRSPIPHLRNLPQEQWLEHNLHYKHLGLYAFRADVLQELGDLPAGLLEQAESLEQLRWLEAGYTIVAGLTDLETPAIDTPEDLKNALEYLKANT